MERSITRIGNERIHALHAGTGDDVVLLHGLAGSGAWWRNNIPALAEHFSLHVPDLIGFGRSRGARVKSMRDVADSVVRWLDARALSATHVIGHSMGGEIAIHIAAQHPARVNKLVLVSAAGIPRQVSMMQAARFVAEIIPPRTWGNRRFLPRIAFDTMRAGPLNMARATANILRDDVTDLLPKIVAPTLLVWGTLDALTPLRDGQQMAGLIPDSRLSVYNGAAHMPMIDQPTRFNEEVNGFLRA
jgi:pimeloyl-ACP methyl ester carboxylesterase